MSDTGIIAGLTVAFLFVVLAATLRAGGASLVRTARADALKAVAADRKGADKVASLLENRSQLQPALGTTITFLTVLAVIPLTWAITDTVRGWALGLALLGMAAALLIVVDVLPRRLGRMRPGGLAYRLAGALTLAFWFGEFAGDLIADVDDDEIEDQQATDAKERELILSVLEFTDTIVSEVMVPRTDMVTIPGEASTDDAVDLVLESGRSRIPVTGDGLDHVVGVLYSRDLLELFDREAAPLRTDQVCHEPYFVPETKQISELLREMQANQLHMAIVVDEFGGTAGLVTIEDLVEEIVGEIADEYDEEEPMVEEMEGDFIVDARLGVDALAALVGTDLPSDNWDTVGGLVLELAGRVPEEGESFDHDGLKFTPTSVQGRRVAKVRVGRL
ncbi:MAG: HlyC/CorC family transporter [Armatimonadetes bacterium]|nr:MAG: HlyC/CorC family transporter [Armatimonadota bacterium]